MKKRPLISVLLPVYQTNIKILDYAVQSILNQTYGHFELIILYEPYNGDGLRDYLDRLKDKRICILETPSQYGLPKSLNLGINASKGKYLARMDADDYSYPKRFEKQVRYMEQHPDIDVLGAAMRIMGKNVKIFEKQGKTSASRAVKLLFQNAGTAHPASFIRKSFLDRNKIQYNEEILGSEDYHLWIDTVICGGKIDQLKEALLDYRISQSQASVKMSSQMMMWNWEARKKLFQAAGRFSIHEEAVFHSWNDVELSYDADEYVKLINRIKKENTRYGLFDKEVLNHELAFQYLLKAILRYKHTKKADLLQKERLKYVFQKQDYAYVMKGMYDWVWTAWKNRL